jgi:hypothetical protein
MTKPQTAMLAISMVGIAAVILYRRLNWGALENKERIHNYL